MLGNNRIEWVEMLGAGSGVGNVLVPINWHFSVDEVAYVRFASVYRQFRDADEFIQEIERMGKK